MENKIRVEHDFGTGETSLQIYLATKAQPPRINEQVDLRDIALQTFVERALGEDAELKVDFPDNNTDNSLVRLRVIESPGRSVWDNSPELEQWLIDQKITFTKSVNGFYIKHQDMFQLGIAYGKYLSSAEMNHN